MTNLNTFNQSATIYYNLSAFQKPQLKTLSQFTLTDFSTLAEYVATNCYSPSLLELPPAKSALLNLFNSIDSMQADKTIDAAGKIRSGYTAVLQHLPRLTIIDYIKLLADSAAAGAIDTQLSENWQAAPDILSKLIDKLTTETVNRSLRIKQFEAERRK